MRHITLKLFPKILVNENNIPKEIFWKYLALTLDTIRCWQLERISGVAGRSIGLRVKKKSIGK